MPTIAWFYGIAIRMYFREHPPPHFHAIYGEHEATVSIENRLRPGRPPAENGRGPRPKLGLSTPRRTSP
jgi:hypothetical protein